MNAMSPKKKGNKNIHKSASALISKFILFSFFDVNGNLDTFSVQIYKIFN